MEGYSNLPDQEKLIDRLTSDVTKFHDIVASFAQLASRQKHTPGQLTQMKRQREDAMALARKIEGTMKQQPSRNDRQRFDKLRSTYRSDLVRFEQTVREVAAKESASVETYRRESMSASPGGGSRLEMGQSAQHMSFVQGQLVTEEMLSKETQQDMLALEADLLEVNAVMKDLSSLVVAQQEGIDNIQNNVEQGLVHVENANKSLRKAGESQKASRKKMCCLIVLILIVILVLGLVFGLLR